jgi:hypothetical protein
MAAQITLDNEWTHIGVLIDRSGSMETLNPTIISKELTDFIKSQTGGRVTVTAARFDDVYEVFIKNQDATNINFTKEDIIPRNNTALYQSFCKLIDDIGDDLSNMTDVRPGKVVIVVLTDGEENSSKGIYEGVKGRELLFSKITHQKEVYNWLFFFLGTNIDALKVGNAIGISGTTCMNFANTQTSCTSAIRTTSEQISKFRGLSAEVMQNRAEMEARISFTNEQRTTCTLPIPTN